MCLGLNDGGACHNVQRCMSPRMNVLHLCALESCAIICVVFHDGGACDDVQIFFWARRIVVHVCGLE